MAETFEEMLLRTQGGNPVDSLGTDATPPAATADGWVQHPVTTVPPVVIPDVPMPEAPPIVLDSNVIPRAAKSDGSFADMSALLGTDFVTDEENKTGFWGYLGGRLATAAGGLTALAGLGGAYVQDAFRDEGDDHEVGAAWSWLMRTGVELAEYGGELSDGYFSDVANERRAAMSEIANDDSMTWGTRAVRIAGELFKEGGGEIVMAEIAGMAVELAAGAAVGGVAATGLRITGATVARTAARAVGKEVVDQTGKKIKRDAAESLVESMAGASLQRRTLNAISSPGYQGIAAIAAGNVATDSYTNMKEYREAVGEQAWRGSVGWSMTRDAMYAATGTMPTEEQVDERMMRTASVNNAAVAYGATLSLSALFPATEGAVVRAMSGAGVRPTFQGMAAGATQAGIRGGIATAARLAGRTAGGAVREATGEALEEGIQSGLTSFDAIQSALSSDTPLDTLFAGLQSPEGIQGAAMGAVIGGTAGGSLGAISRRDDGSAARNETIRRLQSATAEQQANDPALEAEYDALVVRAEQGDESARAAIARWDEEARVSQAQSQQREADRRQAQEEIRLGLMKRTDQARKRAELRGNLIRTYTLTAATGVNPEDLGNDLRFGIGQPHGLFSDGPSARVALSSPTGALAINEDEGSVLYASAENPSTWVALSQAPAAFQQVARTALYLAAKDVSPELDYLPAIDIAMALPAISLQPDTPTFEQTVIDTGTAATEAVETFQAMLGQREEQRTDVAKRAADLAAMVQASAPDPSTVAELVKERDLTIVNARTRVGVAEWNRLMQDPKNHGTIAPPAAVFSDPNSPMGLADYKELLAQVYEQKLIDLELALGPDMAGPAEPPASVITPTRRGARAQRAANRPLVPKERLKLIPWFGLGDTQTAGIDAVVAARDNLTLLKEIAGLTRRRLSTSQGVVQVDEAMRDAASKLLGLHRLRDLYKTALTETKGIGKANIGDLRNIVEGINAIANPEAQTGFDQTVAALLEQQEGDVAGRIGLTEAQSFADMSAASLTSAQQLSAAAQQQLQEQSAADAPLQDAAAAAAAAIEQANTIPDFVRALSMLPPRNTRLSDVATSTPTGVSVEAQTDASLDPTVAAMMQRQQQFEQGLTGLQAWSPDGGSTPTDIVALSMLHNEVQNSAPATEGPANVYGQRHAIDFTNPTTELQEAYNRSVAELAVAQLAREMNRGSDVISMLASMVTEYRIPVDKLSDVFLRAADLATTAGEGVSGRAIIHNTIQRAQAHTDSLVAQAFAEQTEALGDDATFASRARDVASAESLDAAGMGSDFASMMQATQPAENIAPSDPDGDADAGPRGVNRGMASEAGELMPDYVPFATNMAAEKVHDFAANMRQTFSHLSDVLDIHVHDTMEAAKAAIRTPRNNFAAMTTPPTVASEGRSGIHLVADRFENDAQLERKFRHELLGHFALSRLLGPSLHNVTDALMDVVQRGKGEGANIVRRFWDANYKQWEADVRADAADRFGVPDTPEGVAERDRIIRNRLDQVSGYIAQETLATIAEYSAENQLAAKAVAPVLAPIRSLLERAGLTSPGTEQLADIFRQADGFLRSKESDLVKRFKVASATRNREAYDRAADAPFIQSSKIAKFWASLTSDMAGIRQMAAVVDRLAPDMSQMARNLIRDLESSLTTVQSYQSAVLDAHVAPLKSRLGQIKKETSLTEDEIYAYFSAYMVALHAEERNRSFYLLHNRSGFAQSVIEQRNAIIEQAVSSSNPNDWAQVLSRIEALVNSEPNSATAYGAMQASMDYRGVSGVSRGEVARIRQDIPEAVMQAFEKHEVADLNRGAQEAILQLRRESGLYGEEGYRRIMMHNWSNYVPMTKEEGAGFRGDVSDTRSLKENAAEETYSKLTPWYADDNTGIYAQRDAARLLGEDTSGIPEVLLTVIHTLEQDAFYASHELVNAEVGRQAIQLYEGLLAASEGHSDRIRQSYMEVSPEFGFDDPTPTGFSESAPNTLLVGLADGRRQIIHFKDEALAASFMSRFNDPLRGKSEAVKKIAGVTRFMSRAFTSQNPGWVWTKQFPRDIQQNVLIAMSEHGVNFSTAAGITGRSMAYIPRFTSFFMAEPQRRAEMLKEARADKDNPLYNFARRHAEGGIPLYDDSLLSYASRAGQVGAEFATTETTTLADVGQGRYAAQAAGRAISNTYGAVNRVANANATAFDNAARQALFDVLIIPKEEGGAGLTVERAASVVRNTMNFANRSNAGRALAPYFSFAQTALTSLDAMSEERLWRGGRVPRAAVENSTGGYTVRLRDGWMQDLNLGWVAGRIAIGAVSVGMAAMLFGDKDEFGRSDFEKMDVRTLMTGMAVPSPFGGEPLRIPFQIGFDTAFHAVGAAIGLSLISDADAHNANGSLANEVLQVMSQSLTPFSTEMGEPISPSSIFDVIIPTALQPIYGSATGGGLAQSYEDRTAGLYASTATNPVVTDAVRAIEDMLGTSIAPETATQLLREYGGGLWRAADHLSRAIATRNDNLQLIEETGPLARFSDYAGATIRDTTYDAQQSYYYMVGKEKELKTMVDRAKAMDGLPAGTSYSPLNPDPSKMGPNLRLFHQNYGQRYGVLSKALRDSQKELAHIRSAVDVARGSGNNKVVGPLLVQERAIYERAAAITRRIMSDPSTGRMLDIREPEFRRIYTP